MHCGGMAYNKISTCSRDVHRQMILALAFNIPCICITLHYTKTIHLTHRVPPFHFIWLSLLVQYQYSSDILQFLKYKNVQKFRWLEEKQKKTNGKNVSVLRHINEAKWKRRQRWKRVKFFVQLHTVWFFRVELVRDCTETYINMSVYEEKYL